MSSIELVFFTQLRKGTTDSAHKLDTNNYTQTTRIPRFFVPTPPNIRFSPQTTRHKSQEFHDFLFPPISLANSRYIGKWRVLACIPVKYWKFLKDEFCDYENLIGWILKGKRMPMVFYVWHLFHGIFYINGKALRLQCLDLVTSHWHRNISRDRKGNWSIWSINQQPLFLISIT